MLLAIFGMAFIAALVVRGPVGFAGIVVLLLFAGWYLTDVRDHGELLGIESIGGKFLLAAYVVFCALALLEFGIAGVVVGAPVGLILVVLVLHTWYRRKAHNGEL